MAATLASGNYLPLSPHLSSTLLSSAYPVAVTVLSSPHTSSSMDLPCGICYSIQLICSTFNDRHSPPQHHLSSQLSSSPVFALRMAIVSGDLDSFHLTVTCHLYQRTIFRRVHQVLMLKFRSCLLSEDFCLLTSPNRVGQSADK